MLDYLLIGQGLAGTLLHHRLTALGQRVHVLDRGHAHAASAVAAGIVNPITGWRFVKSWRVEEMLPEVERTYQELADLLGQPFYFPGPIVRAIHDIKGENNWDLRTTDPAYRPFLADQAEVSTFAGKIAPAHAYGQVQGGGRVAVRELVQAYRAHLLSLGQITESTFESARLKIGEEGIRYGDMQARRIVFCEGHRGKHNPWFGYLPFGGAKGEVLIIKAPLANFDRLLKQRLFVVPLGEDRYWIGSAYENDYTDELPTAAGRARLVAQLDELLTVPYEIIDHRSAVRPTVKDRRPFLGQHPSGQPLYIFNGLGTKGASLGPYFARQMADHLVGGHPLDPAVDIRRWNS